MINKSIKNVLIEKKNYFNKNDPFKFVQISNFLEQDFLQELITQTNEIKFNLLNTDLYQFYQSNNLSELDKFQILFKRLKSEEWLIYFSQITGHKLKNIDMSVTKYQKTNYLLPHDDRLEGRKIAYIFYLNDLKSDEGGELQLFETINNSPTKIVQNIIPKKNNLLIFEVSKKSFHKVNEVIKEIDRYAISGWFY